MKTANPGPVVLAALLALAIPAAHAQKSTEDLAKAVQNPIASLISVPIQSNNDFDWGPRGEWLSVNNFQPVVPFSLNDDWDVVTRTIVPIVSQPGITSGQGRETGLGDILFTAFFVPKSTGSWIWGVGPAIQLPTATDSRLGADEWAAGPSFVALTMPGNWVVGGLMSNVWGKDIDFFTFQPFVNYNLDGGWYLVSAPIMTRDNEARSGQRWTVPIGGGAGRVFRIGSQPMNFNAQLFYNLEKPDIAGDWGLRLQLQFMFPR
jgi:hypothetical protein